MHVNKYIVKTCSIQYLLTCGSAVMKNRQVNLLNLFNDWGEKTPGGGKKTSQGGNIFFRATCEVIAPPDQNAVYAPDMDPSIGCTWILQ